MELSLSPPLALYIFVLNMGFSALLAAAAHHIMHNNERENSRMF